MVAILYIKSPMMSLNDTLLMAVEIGRKMSFPSPRGPQNKKIQRLAERPKILYIKCVVVLLKCKTKNKGGVQWGNLIFAKVLNKTSIITKAYVTKG